MMLRVEGSEVGEGEGGGDGGSCCATAACWTGADDGEGVERLVEAVPRSMGKVPWLVRRVPVP